MSKKNNNNFINEVEEPIIEETVLEVEEETPVIEEMIPYMVTTKQRLNIRADKSLDSAIIGVFEPDSQFSIKYVDDGWSKLADRDGWVMAKYTSLI